MQPTVESLQGELFALRCHIAALVEVLPLSSQLRFGGRLDKNCLLLRPNQPDCAQDGFDRAVISLAAKRPASWVKPQGESVAR
jgi:hypothetical protein